VQSDPVSDSKFQGHEERLRKSRKSSKLREDKGSRNQWLFSRPQGSGLAAEGGQGKKELRRSGDFLRGSGMGLQQTRHTWTSQYNRMKRIVISAGYSFQIQGSLRKYFPKIERKNMLKNRFVEFFEQDNRSPSAYKPVSLTSVGQSPLVQRFQGFQ
jgi:hypothetical protein